MAEKNKLKTPKNHHQVVIIDGEKYYKPFTEEAIKKINEFKHNQLVHFKAVGEVDVRSVEQLGLYFQACKFVTDRVDIENCSTYKKTDIFARAECNLRDWDNTLIDINGAHTFTPLMSIAFHNMKHLEMCNYFPNAMGFMSGLTPGYGFYTGKFINDVKASCQGFR